MTSAVSAADEITGKRLEVLNGGIIRDRRPARDVEAARVLHGGGAKQAGIRAQVDGIAEIGVEFEGAAVQRTIAPVSPVTAVALIRAVPRRH